MHLAAVQMIGRNVGQRLHEQRIGVHGRRAFELSDADLVRQLGIFNVQLVQGFDVVAVKAMGMASTCLWPRRPRLRITPSVPGPSQRIGGISDW